MERQEQQELSLIQGEIREKEVFSLTQEAYLEKSIFQEGWYFPEESEILILLEVLEEQLSLHFQKLSEQGELSLGEKQNFLEEWFSFQQVAYLKTTHQYWKQEER